MFVCVSLSVLVPLFIIESVCLGYLSWLFLIMIMCPLVCIHLCGLYACVCSLVCLSEYVYLLVCYVVSVCVSAFIHMFESGCKSSYTQFCL